MCALYSVQGDSSHYARFSIIKAQSSVRQEDRIDLTCSIRYIANSQYVHGASNAKEVTLP